METKPNPKSFEDRLDGRFEGILRWEDLTRFWDRLIAQNKPWYIYEVGLAVPTQLQSPEDVKKTVKSIDTFLHKEHDHDYCGIVYADDVQNPTLVKVLNPNNLGASCGTGGVKIWPKYILSLEPPTEVGEKLDENGKPAWWKTLVFKT